MKATIPIYREFRYTDGSLGRSVGRCYNCDCAIGLFAPTARYHSPNCKSCFNYTEKHPKPSWLSRLKTVILRGVK